MTNDKTDKAAAEAAAMEGRQLLAEGFAARDAARIAARFCEDGTYVDAGGPAPTGAIYRGPKAIEGFFRKLFDTAPDLAFVPTAEPVHSGCHIFTQWRATGTQKSGEKVDVDGMDIYTYRGNMVLCKDSYTKHIK